MSALATLRCLALWVFAGCGAIAVRADVSEGSVTLTAKEKPPGDIVPMNVNSSSGEDKVWGVAAIFASVVLTWLLTVYLRNLGNRAHLLVQAAIALRTLAGIRMQAQAGAERLAVPKLMLLLDDIEQQLWPTALQANGLPPCVPWPGATLGGARSKVCEALSAMVALSKAAAAPAADALRATLRRIVAGMVAGAKGDGARSLRDHLADAAGSVGTPEPLLVQVTALGAAGWVFLLLVTTLAGAYVLVLGPAGAGFATVTDYEQCLLLGSGLPAGAQLMQSTTASVATSFGVTR